MNKAYITGKTRVPDKKSHYHLFIPPYRLILYQTHIIQTHISPHAIDINDIESIIKLVTVGLNIKVSI